MKKRNVMSIAHKLVEKRGYSFRMALAQAHKIVNPSIRITYFSSLASSGYQEIPSKRILKCDSSKLYNYCKKHIPGVTRITSNDRGDSSTRLYCAYGKAGQKLAMVCINF